MIRNLLATTAVATLIATGAMAQSTTPTSPTMPQDQAAPAQPMVKKAEGELASNIIGESVYNGSGDDAENIGEVNDLVLNPDGTVKAVVIGVGGFLGIGQKDVAIEYDLVEWVERDNDRFLVVETTAEALKAQEEFDKAAFEPVPADSDVAETEPATEEDLKQAEQQTAAEQAEGEQPADAEQTTTTTTAPAADSGEDAAEAPAEEPADQAAEAPAEEPADQAAEAPAEQPADQAAEAPAEEPADQAAEAPAEQPADQAAEAPAEDSADQSAAATTDQPADQSAAAPAEEPADQAAEQSATGGAATDTTTTAAVDRSTLQEVNIGEIGTDEFVGTTVYGANDETIGEIGEVVLTDDGKVDAVLIDVGGFLGIGEKQVAVGMDNLQFMADQDGNRYLYTGFTKEQLEAAPAYDEAQWAENRDQMRLTVEN